MKKRTIIVAALCGALALAGAGVVMAQQGGGSGSDGTSFLDRVAQKLGIDRPKLDQAIKDARSDQIDAAVADGKITQEQADRLKQRLDELPDDGVGPGFGFGFGRGFPWAGPHGRGFGFGLGLGDAKAKLAGFLGISQEQLQDELGADGASLASVAQAHGKSRDELKAFIQTEAGKSLDAAVAGGKLTQEQADRIEQGLSDHLDALIDAKCGGFGHGRPSWRQDRQDDDHDEDDDATPGAQRAPIGLGDFAPMFRS